MFEMALLVLLAVAMAAKSSRGKRKFRAYLRGNVDEVLALSTLASLTLISAVFDEVVDEQCWVSSVRAIWAMQRFSTQADDGPIMVGLAHSDYSDAEIEEFIENTGSWTRGDLVAQERARRKIRIVGIFETGALSSAEATVLNDGKPITTKCGWMLVTGATLRFWAYNLGTSPLATTDPRLELQGHANLWPR